MRNSPYPQEANGITGSNGHLLRSKLKVLHFNSVHYWVARSIEY